MNDKELTNRLKDQDLEPISRDIFRFRYIQDKSIEEIASKLDLSTSAVYTRLSRGRRKLKKIMEGYHE